MLNSLYLETAVRLVSLARRMVTAGWQQDKARSIQQAVHDRVGQEVRFIIKNRKSGSTLGFRIKPPTQAPKDLYEDRDKKKSRYSRESREDPRARYDTPGEVGVRFVMMSDSSPHQENSYQFIGWFNPHQSFRHLEVRVDNEGFPLVDLGDLGPAVDRILYDILGPSGHVNDNLEILSISFRKVDRFISEMELDKWAKQKSANR